MVKDLAPAADAEFLHSEEFQTEKNFRDRIDPFKHYTDAEFKLRYRFAKETVRVLIDLLDEKLRPQTNRAHAVYSRDEQTSLHQILRAGPGRNLKSTGRAGPSEPRAGPRGRPVSIVKNGKPHPLSFPNISVFRQHFSPEVQDPGVKINLWYTTAHKKYRILIRKLGKKIRIR